MAQGRRAASRPSAAKASSCRCANRLANFFCGASLAAMSAAAVALAFKEPSSRRTGRGPTARAQTPAAAPRGRTAPAVLPAPSLAEGAAPPPPATRKPRRTRPPWPRRENPHHIARGGRCRRRPRTRRTRRTPPVPRGSRMPSAAPVLPRRRCTLHTRLSRAKQTGDHRTIRTGSRPGGRRTRRAASGSTAAEAGGVGTAEEVEGGAGTAAMAAAWEGRARR
eukprot:scaffold4240_cov120-Isochrysis_galbana.AAC.3